MTVEKIERVYLSPTLEYDMIEQLKCDKDWTMVGVTTTCFIFEKCKKSHIDIAVKAGDKE